MSLINDIIELYKHRSSSKVIMDQRNHNHPLLVEIENDHDLLSHVKSLIGEIKVNECNIQIGDEKMSGTLNGNSLDPHPGNIPHGKNNRLKCR